MTIFDVDDEPLRGAILKLSDLDNDAAQRLGSGSKLVKKWLKKRLGMAVGHQHCFGSRVVRRLGESLCHCLLDLYDRVFVGDAPGSSGFFITSYGNQKSGAAKDSTGIVLIPTSKKKSAKFGGNQIAKTRLSSRCQKDPPATPQYNHIYIC